MSDKWAFFEAVHENNLLELKRLVTDGFNVKLYATGFYGILCEYGYLDMIKYIYSIGCDVNHEKKDVMYTQIEIVEYLVDYVHIKLRIKDIYNLFYNGHVELVSKLINNNDYELVDNNEIYLLKLRADKIITNKLINGCSKIKLYMDIIIKLQC